MRYKLPLLFYLVGIAYVLASLVFLFGVIQTITSWNWLIAINYRPHPAYNIFENAFFFLVFLVSAVSLWIRKPWAPLFCQISAALGTIWLWFDRVFLVQNHLPFKQHIFPLALSILILLFLLLSLSLLQPYMKELHPVRNSEKDSGDNDENSPAGKGSEIFTQ